MAATILAAAQEKKVELLSVDAFQSVTGKDVTGTIESKEVAIGNAAFMSDCEASTETLRGRAEALQAEGQTVM